MLFIAEDDFLIIERADYLGLNDFLDDEKEQFYDSPSDLNTVYLVNILLESKLLLRAPCLINYFNQKFSNEIIEERKGFVTIHFFSQQIEEVHRGIRFFEEISCDFGFDVAIVDDLLDPRLIDFSNQQSKKNRPGIPVQIRADDFLFGPWFSNSNKNNLQYQSLSGILLKNKPLLQWGIDQMGFIPFPPVKVAGIPTKNETK